MGEYTFVIFGGYVSGVKMAVIPSLAAYMSRDALRSVSS